MSGTHSPRILVVDDDELVLKTISHLLEADGYTADTAVSGSQALDSLQQRPYNGILCDMWMPGMTGRDLFETIEHELPQFRSRIIFLTGDLASEFTWNFIDSNELPYVLKPFNIADFRKKIREMISGEESPEKRNTERKPASGRVHVRKKHWATGGPDITPVVNVARNGMLFQTERLYHVGADVLACFPYRGVLQAEQEGVVVRVTAVSEKQWEVALAFGPAAEKFRVKLRQ